MQSAATTTSRRAQLFCDKAIFFSAERQKSPEIPRRRKRELEQVEKGESEELLRSSSPFIGSAERDFPLSPCVFPSSQT